MVDILIGAVLVAVLGGAAGYVYKEKKRGTKCVGCPHGKNCSGSCCSCEYK